VRYVHGDLQLGVLDQLDGHRVQRRLVHQHDQSPGAVETRPLVQHTRGLGVQGALDLKQFVDGELYQGLCLD
jgi:hypothetical protein